MDPELPKLPPKPPQLRAALVVKLYTLWHMILTAMRSKPTVTAEHWEPTAWTPVIGFIKERCYIAGPDARQTPLSLSFGDAKWLRDNQVVWNSYVHDIIECAAEEVIEHSDGLDIFMTLRHEVAKSERRYHHYGYHRIFAPGEAATFAANFFQEIPPEEWVVPEYTWYLPFDGETENQFVERTLQEYDLYLAQPDCPPDDCACIDCPHNAKCIEIEEKRKLLCSNRERDPKDYCDLDCMKPDCPDCAAEYGYGANPDYPDKTVSQPYPGQDPRPAGTILMF